MCIGFVLLLNLIRRRQQAGLRLESDATQSHQRVSATAGEIIRVANQQYQVW